MWHSGTLAGAKQGVLFGRRGIAVSAPATYEEPDLQALVPSVEEVLQVLLPAPDLALVNVNLPSRSPIGLCWTRQSVRHYDGEVIPGKDPMGHVTLNAYQQGNSVVLDVTDDGRGIDPERIRAVAVSRGLVSEKEVVDQQRAYELMFTPGFSTAAEVSEISEVGR